MLQREVVVCELFWSSFKLCFWFRQSDVGIFDHLDRWRKLDSRQYFWISFAYISNLPLICYLLLFYITCEIKPIKVVPSYIYRNNPHCIFSWPILYWHYHVGGFPHLWNEVQSFSKFALSKHDTPLREDYFFFFKKNWKTRKTAGSPRVIFKVRKGSRVGR